jgi:hypothetical protein
MAHGRKLVTGAAAAAAIGVVALAALQADGRLLERTKSVTVPVDTGPGGTASATARCPRGKRVVLGGLDVPLSVEDVTITHLKRAPGRGWRAGAVNYDADEEATLMSIAYCGSLKDIRARERTVKVPEQGQGERPVTVTAQCRRGERLAFGGFDYDQGPQPGQTNDTYLSELRRKGKRGWQVGAFNFTGEAPLTAIAYCSHHAPRTTTVEEGVNVDPSGRGRVQAKCEGGERLAFGGYKADVTHSRAFILLRSLKRTSGRAWQVSARNTNTQGAGDLTAFAYCAKQ